MAIDDSVAESAVETVEIGISLDRINQVFIQVSPSAQTARLGILDDDCKSFYDVSKRLHFFVYLL